MFEAYNKSLPLSSVCVRLCCKARLDRPNDGSRSAGEGLCVLQSFLFTTQQEQ